MRSSARYVRVGAPPPFVLTDATERDDVASISGLASVIDKIGCTSVLALAVDGIIAVAVLRNGDLHIICDLPASSDFAFFSSESHLLLMKTIAHMSPENGFVLTLGSLEASSVHAHVVQAAFAAFLPPKVCEYLCDFLSIGSIFSRNGAARLTLYQIGPF